MERAIILCFRMVAKDECLAHTLQNLLPVFRGRFGHPALLPVVLGTLALTLTSAGCLWPSDITERQTSENPPVIDRKKVSPSPDSVVELTSLTTDFSVEGAVTDLDSNLEGLEYHWYLGYVEQTEPKPPDFTGYSSIRLNACAFQPELDPPGSLHVLELIVSDGPIVFDRVNGREIGGGYAYLSWTVRSQVACQ